MGVCGGNGTSQLGNAEWERYVTAENISFTIHGEERSLRVSHKVDELPRQDIQTPEVIH